MKRRTNAYEVTLILDRFRIDGHVHIDRELPRFQEAWAELLRGRRDFVPVTDAVISGDEGDQLATMGFVLVPKRDVRAAFPRDPVAGGGGDVGAQVRRSGFKLTIALENLSLTGLVHIDPDKRNLADAWESLLKDRRSFLPVTKVTMQSYDGVNRGTCDLLLVDKDDIQAAYPARTDEDMSRRPNQIPATASIMLDRLRIDGTLFLDRAQSNFDRFSDRWDGLMRDHRSFIRLVDASVLTADGERLISMAPFVLVEKPAIRAVLPGD